MARAELGAGWVRARALCTEGTVTWVQPEVTQDASYRGTLVRRLSQGRCGLECPNALCSEVVQKLSRTEVV